MKHNSLLEQLNFLKIALLDYKIGALSRSSKYVVNAVVRDFDNQSLQKVVEFGPGDGVMTKELLHRMPSHGQLIIIESSPRFIEVLKKIEDPRLKIIEGTIQDALKELEKNQLSNIDLVVSSIPFSMLKPDERDKVVHDTFNILHNNGEFVIFHQYSRLMLTPLKKYFNNVTSHFEPRNFLPCFIMYAKK